MEDTLTSIRNRVRFKLYTQLTREQYTENLKQYINDNSEKFTGTINSEMAIIYIRNANQNYWKPNLTITTEKDGDNTVVRGIFGPSSSVWTFYMFMYFLLGIALMVFGSMYFVEKQINTNNYPWALTAAIITTVLLIGNYIVSRVGQHLSQDEMKLLRHFAEESTLPHETVTPSAEV